MSGRYLLELADVCRAAGLEVQEEPGWQTRARSSGGYGSGRPTHVMTHHTASGPGSDGQADVDYCCYGSADRPLANLYLSRSARVWIMAAGCTNTNGQGHDSWGGGVPDDSMNTYAIGIEAANRGDSSEAWPAVQQEGYGILVGALRSAFGISSHHVRQHAEWAVGRKIDPAGPARWAQTGTWNGDAFRADIAAGWPGGAILLPDGGEPMEYLELMGNSTQYSLFARAGVFVVNITNAERDADKRTRDPVPRTVRTTDATVLKSLVLCGDEPVWYDGSKWPPVAAFGGRLT